MDTPMNLEIVSPERVVFSGDIEMVEMPGKNGRFAILPHHAPIIATLAAGPIRVKPVGGDERSFDCQAGYVECSANKVSILLNA